METRSRQWRWGGERGCGEAGCSDKPNVRLEGREHPGWSPGLCPGCQWTPHREVVQNRVREKCCLLPLPRLPFRSSFSFIVNCYISLASIIFHTIFKAFTWYWSLVTFDCSRFLLLACDCRGRRACALLFLYPLLL